MKRIAIIIPTICSFGGEQRVVSILANEISKNNKVTIFALDKKYTKPVYSLKKDIEVVNTRLYSENPIKKIARIAYKLGLIGNERIIENIYYDNKAVNKLVSLVKDRFDYVIAISGDLSILLGKSRGLLDETKTIGWEHNSYEAYFKTKGKYCWKKDNLFKQYVSKLDKCVVLNNAISKHYYKEFGIECEVIPNPRSFKTDVKSKLINKSFVTTGRFVYQKGFDLLLESFRLFSQKNSDWNLYIYGDGRLRHKLSKLIRKYHLEKRVFLEGFTKDIESKLVESSVYLLSSRWEGFPMCITEALESGLPCVSYNITAVEPLLTHGEGLLAEPFDVADFADKMVELSESYELRKHMSRIAVQTAETLSISNIIKKWDLVIS